MIEDIPRWIRIVKKFDSLKKKKDLDSSDL